MTVEITDANFQEKVLGTDKLVVIDFWAEWCGPCKMIGPVVEELSNAYPETVVVGKLDVDTNPNTAMEFMVRSIPTIIFVKNGKVVDRHVGATSIGVLKGKVDSLLS
jgi:thioredoxin 1